jgi:hypothetical protein
MDRSSMILVVLPVATQLALFMGTALPFVATSRSGRSHPRGAAAHAAARKRTGATPAGYLYAACDGIGHQGRQTGTHRWVQAVPIVRKTAKLIYYTSDSWDRHQAVVSPGCVSREQFETDTRCRDDCSRGQARCHHGYPAGVIPVPADRRCPGPASRLFFATREAAEDYLHRGERERAGQPGPDAAPIRELRRVMANAHPDRGGTAEQFIEAHRRYETALQRR